MCDFFLTIIMIEGLIVESEFVPECRDSVRHQSSRVGIIDGWRCDVEFIFYWLQTEYKVWLYWSKKMGLGILILAF